MGVNRGKDFEAIVKKSIEGLGNVSIDRLPDPMAGFAGVRNICDFAIYKLPFQYYIECKTLTGNTLNFKSGITKNQWDGMVDKSTIPGVMAGVLVWFIDHNITAFVPIQELVYSQKQGNKSLNISDLHGVKLMHIKMNGRKKRVFFDYNTQDFMIRLGKYTANYWGIDING